MDGTAKVHRLADWHAQLRTSLLNLYRDFTIATVRLYMHQCM